MELGHLFKKEDTKSKPTRTPEFVTEHLREQMVGVLGARPSLGCD